MSDPNDGAQGPRPRTISQSRWFLDALSRAAPLGAHGRAWSKISRGTHWGDVLGVHIDLRSPEIEASKWQPDPFWIWDDSVCCDPDIGPPLLFPGLVTPTDLPTDQGEFARLNQELIEEGLEPDEASWCLTDVIPLRAGDKIVVTGKQLRTIGGEWLHPDDGQVLEARLAIERADGSGLVQVPGPLSFYRRDALRPAGTVGQISVKQLVDRVVAEAEHAPNRTGQLFQVEDLALSLVRARRHPRWVLQGKAVDGLLSLAVAFGYAAGVWEQSMQMRRDATSGAVARRQKRKAGLRKAEVAEQMMAKPKLDALSIARSKRSEDRSISQADVAIAIKDELRNTVPKHEALLKWVRRWERDGDLTKSSRRGK